MGPALIVAAGGGQPNLRPGAWVVLQTRPLPLPPYLQATLQSVLDLTDRALAGLSSADSTVVGGVVIAAVLAVLVRWVVGVWADAS